jgi:hypothetical protein
MRLLILLLALALAPAPAVAQVISAYEGRAAVEDQSAAQRARGLRESLSQVLARVSGAAGIAASGRTTAILDRAETLLRSVAYQSDDKGQLMLVASFDPAGVEAALKGAGLPVWGVMAGELETVNLRINAVDSVATYARVLSTLQDLPMVRTLVVIETREGALLLRLEVEGGTGRLAGALSVTSTLKRENGEPGTLTYRAGPG